MKPADRKAFLKRLLKDIKIVENEVDELHWHHYGVYKRTVAVITANPRMRKGNWLFDWMFAAHANSACVAIRRLLDEDARDKPVSLARITMDLIKHPKAITRDEFVRGYSESMRRAGFADDDFDRFAGVGKSEIDPSILSKWLSDAKSECARIRQHVDKRVAHRDRNPPTSVPKWPELDAAVDAVKGLFRNICLLLTRNEPDTPTLTGWEWVFEEPWIARDSANAD
jgi:hypothetical protein